MKPTASEDHPQTFSGRLLTWGSYCSSRSRCGKRGRLWVLVVRSYSFFHAWRVDMLTRPLADQSRRICLSLVAMEVSFQATWNRMYWPRSSIRVPPARCAQGAQVFHPTDSSPGTSSLCSVPWRSPPHPHLAVYPAACFWDCKSCLRRRCRFVSCSDSS
jgi:hypothetical protein